MGSLPDSQYIIQTDGYYYVYSHDVDPSKGYITVSAKGVANGLSDKPNDDADFGPDTYNPNYTGSGIPYTQTSGIAEAETYIMNNISGYDYPGTYSTIKIKLLTGNFKCSSAGQMHNSSLLNAIIIEGQGSSATNIDLTDMPAGDYLFDIQNIGNLYNLKISGMRYASYNTGSGSGGLINYVVTNDPDIMLDDVNMGTNAFSGHSVIIQGSSTAMPFLVQLNNCNATYSFDEGWYIAYAHQVTMVGGGGGVGMTFENCFSFAGLGVHVGQIQHISCNTVYYNGTHNVNLAVSGDIDNITIMGGNSYVNDPPIVIPANQTLTLKSLVIDGLIALDYASNVDIVSIGSGATATINNIQALNLSSNNTFGFIVNLHNSPTTPTVPASGTAQPNTNPYPVNVYLYGGTVTVIDYTQAGGSATEVGTSGPATVGLNPGDSITLTYSAAPTWKWVAV